MAKTMYDGGLWTPDESWRTVRSIRAAPPDGIASVLADKRADVFHTALEQAEQLYGAAFSAGRESRPLLLFYGLSQAGRALAAASSALDGSDWESSSHGIRSITRGVEPSNFWATEIKVDPSNKSGKFDTFSRASIALRSATDIGSTTIGAAAANIIEFIYEFRAWDLYPRVVQVDPMSIPNGWEIVPDLVTLPIRLHGDDASHAGEPGFLTTIPALAKYELAVDESGAPEFDHNGLLVLRIPKAEFEDDGWLAWPEPLQRYRGSHVAVRKIGDAATRVHPLMVWWMALHALSMLARYAPREWQSVLNIRSSPVSSQVEFLLDRAVDAVPQLLAESLAALNSGGKIT